MTSVPYIEVIKVKKKQLESYLVHISDLSHVNWKKIQHANFFMECGKTPELSEVGCRPLG